MGAARGMLAWPWPEYLQAKFFTIMIVIIIVILTEIAINIAIL